MNAVIKYPGAKWCLTDWILPFFPPHHSYLEAFFGSGAVLFRKPRSNIETVNDLDGEVVNLFEWIRHDPERLARDILLTPYARQEYEMAIKSNSTDSYIRAKSFFIKLNMGYGYRTNEIRVGWKNDIQGRERAYAAGTWCKLPNSIIEVAERLQGVQIECRTAQELIPRFNYSNVLIYCDPPYILDTRHGKQYRHEMTDKDHVQLLEILLAHKGPVLLSGYESSLYDKILHGWHKEYATTYAQNAGKRKEVIWMNFEPPAQQMTFGG